MALTLEGRHMLVTLVQVSIADMSPVVMASSLTSEDCLMVLPLTGPAV